MRQELIESPTGISHLIIIFVFVSQVPFEPLLHRPVQLTGTVRPAACEPIVVLGRVGYSGVQWRQYSQQVYCMRVKVPLVS